MGLLALGFGFEARAACEGGSVLSINGGTGNDQHCDFYSDLSRVRSSFGAGRSDVCHTSMTDGGSANFQQTMTEAGCSGPASSFPPASVAPEELGFEGLRASALRALRATPPGAPLTLYFTDHGTSDGGESSVSLGYDAASVEQMRELLAAMRAERPDQRFILIHDHCFSGGMLDEIMDAAGAADGRTCGFASSDRHEVSLTGQSFGAQAEAITRSRYRGLRDAVDSDRDGAYSYGEVFRYYDRSYATASGGYGSTPTSSSDVFLENRFGRYFSSSSGRRAMGSRTELARGCLYRVSSTGLPGEGIPQTLRALLDQRLGQLRADLRSYYVGAGVSSTVSYDQVQALVSAHDARNVELDRRSGEVLSRAFDVREATINRAFAAVNAPAAARLAELESMGGNTESFCSHPVGRVEAAACCASASTPQANTQCYMTLPSEVEERLNTERTGLQELRQPHVSAGDDDPEYQRLEAESRSLREQWKDSLARGQAQRRLLKALRNMNTLEAIREEAANSASADRAQAAQRDLATYLNLLDCEDTPMAAVPRM